MRIRPMEPAVPAPVSLLTVQFLAWVADRPRTYADVMDAWRSSCPRNPVWEDAIIDGLVRFENGSRGAVVLTPLGRATLDTQSRPQSETRLRLETPCIPRANRYISSVR